MKLRKTIEYHNFQQKRTAFPRFYFIGDDDLLEILGQSTNPQVIQTHMKKLFQGINRVVFSSTGETIISIVSSEGETVTLSKSVRVVPQVETWLQQLSDEMRRTLRDQAAQAVSDPQPSLEKYPSQILCLAEEVKFTDSVEKVLGASSDLSSFKNQLLEKLKAYTNMKVEDKVSDLKLKSLILDLIHHIDVVDQLVSNKANSTSCWTWQRQLRFYLVSGGVVLRQVSSEFEYTYEYQGNYAKLVHTPLTDKCYLTLTQGLRIGWEHRFKETFSNVHGIRRESVRACWNRKDRIGEGVGSTDGQAGAGFQLRRGNRCDFDGQDLHGNRRVRCVGLFRRVQ